VPMTLDFDIAMFQAMVERMLQEGEIPRVYDEDGNPDEDGNYGVTLDHIVGAAEGQEFMTTEFKVWRFAGDSNGDRCGYLVAAMDLDVDLVEGQGVVLNAGEVAVIEAFGSVALVEDNQQIVDDNQKVVETFRSGVAENLATTINYDALQIEGSNIVFETLYKETYPDHLETWPALQRRVAQRRRGHGSHDRWRDLGVAGGCARARQLGCRRRCTRARRSRHLQCEPNRGGGIAALAHATPR
jgi:hypothetical protein